MMDADKNLIQQDIIGLKKRMKREEELGHNNIEAIPLFRMHRLIKVIEDNYLKPVAKPNRPPRLKLTKGRI